MSPRKLTNADKEELLVAYRDTAATTSTLAENYGVSSSTISRFLKSRLSTEEYEDLIQKKRLGRSNSLKKAKAIKSEPTKSEDKVSSKRKPKSRSKAKSSEVTSVEKSASKKEKPAKKSPKPEIKEVKIAAEQEAAVLSEEQEKPRKRRTRSRRSRTKVEEKPLLLLEELENQSQKAEAEQTASVTEEPILENREESDADVNQDLLALAQEIRLGDRQQALKDLLGDDIDDLDDDDEDDDEYDEEDDGAELESVQQNLPDAVEILPLNQASFPRTCYVVTDRMSELIARPLKEFRELGYIPEEETRQKTLPIFDNHRVAKRFTHGRSQKVIKVPDSRLFLKTRACLTAKGITRVLLDGQVYDVSLDTANSPR